MDIKKMDDAPKDGSHILAFAFTKKHRCWLVVHWLRGQWVTVPGDYGCGVSLWTELPPSPFDIEGSK
jgi:hypothetical protein